MTEKLRPISDVGSSQRSSAKSSGRVLQAGFYDRRTATVARDLLGKVLRVRDAGRWRSGVIVETEAYVKNDPANHAFRGPNKRNQSMFEAPGTAYVYRIHQVCCVNAVTRLGEAVLIRAVQPLENVNLPADGPGRLCRAFDITKDKHDGSPLTGLDIHILEGNEPPFRVFASKRIGITKAKNRMLRFFAEESSRLGQDSAVKINRKLCSPSRRRSLHRM